MQIQSTSPFSTLADAGTSTGSTTGSASTSTGAPDTTTNPNANPTEATFLQLLVAQMQNQDPTQPQDPTAFVGELAQFSELQSVLGIQSDTDTLVKDAGGASTTASAASGSATTAATNPSTTPITTQSMAATTLA